MRKQDNKESQATSSTFAKTHQQDTSSVDTFRFSDNRDSGKQQQHLQNMVNASPKVTKGAEIQRMAHPSKTPLQLQTNAISSNSNLPESLKTGAEHLSGVSLNDVKVHYNSAQPAQLNALAYAQGNNIHLGPGQEKHLPHETWHVVQQKQGRVKANTSVNGTLVNDSKSLETEADQYGKKATQLKTTNENKILNEQPLSTHVAQRVISEQKNVEDAYKTDFNAYLNELDKATTKAYFYLLHYPTLDKYKTLDGHTEYWVEVWDSYMKGTFKDMGLLSAAFGYAVESLATLIYLPLPEGGLSISLQGIRKGTRPDVVLKDGSKDVGWLDITASGSKGHIWGKQGWEGKQIHLGEVTYPSLNPEVIKDNVQHNRQYDDNTDPKEVMHRVNYFKFIQNIRRKHWENIGKKYFSTPYNSKVKTIKQRYIRQRLADYLGLNFRDLPPQKTVSLLYAMRVGETKHGYNVQNKKKAFDKKRTVSKSRPMGESLLQQYDRELPNLELGLTLGTQMKTDEEAEKLIMQNYYAHSGKNDFETQLPPEDLSDEYENNQEVSDHDDQIVKLGSNSNIKVLDIGKQLVKNLNTTIELDLDSLKFLSHMMKKHLKNFSARRFGVLLQTTDGSLISVVLDDSEKMFIKSRIANEERGISERKKKREQILWEKRKESTMKLEMERSLSRPIPRAPNSINFQGVQLSSDIIEIIQNNHQGTIVGFFVETENGEQQFIGNSSLFQSELEY